MEIIQYIVVGLISLGIGFYIGRSLLVKIKEKEFKLKADKIINDAENVTKEKEIQAKEKFLELKSEFEKESNKKKNILKTNETKLKQKEQHLNKSLDQIKKRETELKNTENQLKHTEKNLKSQKEAIAKKKEDVEIMHTSQVQKLEKIANLTAEEAKTELIDALKSEAQSTANAYIKDLMEETKLTASKKAKKLVIESIQRNATEHAIENCVSIFNIESDEIKGKIIGREGRNIRALEAATGVEIIVDDTPEAIIISGFDPVRREVARLALYKLVTDGRIHPARIEEVVSKVRKQINEEIIDIGERTVIDLSIHGLHPELIKMVGRMRFRSSYGQNLLQHSREVSNLCAIMAAELGLNVKHAKRAGLLHDIGKVVPEEPELPHAILGMDLAKKHKEHPDVCNAIGAHHDEIEMTCMIAPIIQACDAISGARPGARREVMESYIKRLKELEKTALNFDGVEKCYAIQAGRELRVMVDAQNVSDDKAGMLSFEIAQKIEKEMQYPGQIKVTVIREMRAVNFAK